MFEVVSLMIKTLPIPPWFHSTNTFLFLVLSPTLQSSRFQQLNATIFDALNLPYFNCVFEFDTG
jgi:hypothetical protein